MNESPKTYWVDQSCIQKGFNPVAVQESFRVAARGSSRLLNRNDNYLAWVFQLLFKTARDLTLPSDGITVTWEAVGEQLRLLSIERNSEVLNHIQEVLAWTGSMTLGLNRDDADVRIYCGERRPQHLLPCRQKRIRCLTRIA